jgi:uncharacterized protein YPO0396
MNAITKALKHQEKSALKKIKNRSFHAFESLISQSELLEVLQKELPNYRNRLYTPTQTLCMFIAQALNSDNSCQNVVNEMALNTNQSVATGGYCKAHKRLSQTMVSELTKAVSAIPPRVRISEGPPFFLHNPLKHDIFQRFFMTPILKNKSTQHDFYLSLWQDKVFHLP